MLTFEEWYRSLQDELGRYHNLSSYSAEMGWNAALDQIEEQAKELKATNIARQRMEEW